MKSKYIIFFAGITVMLSTSMFFYWNFFLRMPDRLETADAIKTLKDYGNTMSNKYFDDARERFQLAMNDLSTNEGTILFEKYGQIELVSNIRWTFYSNSRFLFGVYSAKNFKAIAVLKRNYGNWEVKDVYIFPFDKMTVNGKIIKDTDKPMHQAIKEMSQPVKLSK